MNAPGAARAPAVEAAALPAAWVERIPELEAMGFEAFTTTRAWGSFGTQSTEPVSDVLGRWRQLQVSLGRARFATATQVHGAEVVDHVPGWTGWLRATAADGHMGTGRGIALAVTVADCVPVFLAHPSGAIALVHSGWRGTEARITEVAIRRLAARGCAPADLVVVAGPAICGRCYEVSPEVHARLTGRTVERPTTVDLRALIAGHARAAGVRQVATSARCTRCDNDQFYSHRAGDAGRQVGVLAS